MEVVGLIVKVLSFQITWMPDRAAPPPWGAGINSPTLCPQGPSSPSGSRSSRMRDTPASPAQVWIKGSGYYADLLRFIFFGPCFAEMFYTIHPFLIFVFFTRGNNANFFLPLKGRLFFWSKKLHMCLQIHYTSEFLSLRNSTSLRSMAFFV